MTRILAHKRCPICHFKRSNVLRNFTTNHLVKCENCKLVYAERIPSEQELSDYYANYNRGRHVSELTLKKYRELLTNFLKYRKTNRVLDVGCGSGFFLGVASALGWEAYGTEFGNESVDFCKAKGLKVYEGPIEKINLEPESFDIITSFEVVEHLTYPLEHFETLFRLLRPGGILYVTTPNFNAVTRYILKADWNIITYPEHLTYFTAKTLNHGLESVGFKRNKLIADGISIDRLRNSFAKKKVVSEKERQSTKSGKKVLFTNESVRQASENNLVFRMLRKSIDFSLNATRSGEFLKGYYIKPD